MFSFVSYALFAVIEGLFATWEATLYFGVLWFDQFHVLTQNGQVLQKEYEGTTPNLSQEHYAD
jgi:hypothetical protein